MKNSPRPQDRENPSPLTSPKSNSSNSSSSSSSNSNGVQHPVTPKPIPRSETNAYPTTFIQADSSSFKKVVQMLTGSPETAKHASKATADQSSKSVIPPIKTGPKKQGFKLYERRNSLKNLMISPLKPRFVQGSGFSPRKSEILSPSVLDLPSLALSPVTPLIPDPFNRYPHPSPDATPRDSEPRLLSLFPVTSPRVSESSS